MRRVARVNSQHPPPRPCMQVLAAEGQYTHWSLFQRLVLAAELLDAADGGGPEGMAFMHVWLRLSSNRVLDWYRKSNYQVGCVEGGGGSAVTSSAGHAFLGHLSFSSAQYTMAGGRQKACIAICACPRTAACGCAQTGMV